MKLVHAADLHIDSPLAGLARYENAPVDQIRSATRRATENLVQCCLDEGACLLVLAGDLFDGDWKDYSTGLFFTGQMARLRQAGVQVALVRGNHDAASQIEKHLRLPDNVFSFPHEQAGTRRYDEFGIAVHGRSYAHRAETDNLARTYPQALDNYLNIGVLHTSLSGRPGHAPYAPCTLEELVAKGYDYWALGHVHQREVLCESPWVVFSGNLQGRHVREVGPKGATVVTVTDGRIVDVAHHALDVVRFVVVKLEAPELADAETVCEYIAQSLTEEATRAEGRTLVARVHVGGPTVAHAALQREADRWLSEIRSLIAESDALWVESVRFETRRRGVPIRWAERKDALGEVAASLAALKHDGERKAELQALFSDFVAKLPAEVRQGEDGLRLDDPASFDPFIDDVERLLLEQLSGEES